jgi:hypothetical protein
MLRAAHHLKRWSGFNFRPQNLRAIGATYHKNPIPPSAALGNPFYWTKPRSSFTVSIATCTTYSFGITVPAPVPGGNSARTLTA